MTEGFINKIIPFSAVDGPGNRMTIFLQGCNFNCIYCHNPETIKKCKHCGECVSLCPEGALKKENGTVQWDKESCVECGVCTGNCGNSSSPKVMQLTAEQIVDGIRPYKHFIDGITVSGGECTLQKGFLGELFELAVQEGLSCMIDSNGSCDFEEQEELLKWCEGVMLDVKVYDEKTHLKYIGTTNKMVLKNLEFLAKSGKLYEVRTVIVPELFDNEETVREVAKILKQSETIIRYKLIAFRPVGVKHHEALMMTPTQTYMESLRELALEEGAREVILVGH